jgi:hypothetical protein
MKCELVKRKENGTELAIVRELRERRAGAHTDVAVLWMKKWRAIPWRGCNRCDIIVLKKPNYVEKRYIVEHWRLYECPDMKPYVIQRFYMVMDYKADHEEELGTSPVFVWERVKDYTISDVIRELKATINFDVSVLFERLARVEGGRG